MSLPDFIFNSILPQQWINFYVLGQKYVEQWSISSVDYKAIGIPMDWQSEPLWQEIQALKK